MTKAEFVALHRPCRPDTAQAEFFRTKCVQPKKVGVEWQPGQAGALPIFDGQFTTWGYFAAGQNPDALNLNWAALDQALRQARQWADTLREAGCRGAIGSEGDAPFWPFVQALPRHGHGWDAESITGPLPEPLQDAIDDGAYESNYESEVQFVDVDDQQCLFMADEEWEEREEDALDDFNDDLLDDEDEDDEDDPSSDDDSAKLPADLAAFRAVSDEMRRHLRQIVVARLYPSFQEFPQLYIGEDEADQLVGLATTCVWT